MFQHITITVIMKLEMEDSSKNVMICHILFYFQELYNVTSLYCHNAQKHGILICTRT